MNKTHSIALLDTDYISKTITVTDNGTTTLLDVILSLENYDFYCHEQIRKEIERHSTEMAEWLDKQISCRKLCLYTDEDILMLTGDLDHDITTCLRYLEYYRKACEATGSTLFDKYSAYLDFKTYDRDEFIEMIQNFDKQFSRGNGLGEIKTFILAQALNESEIERKLYVFRSNDRNARTGAVNITPGIRCVSLLSAFQWLKNEISWSEDNAEQFIVKPF